MKPIKYSERFEDFCEAMAGDGAFLVVTDKSGKQNVMTIGWSTIGVVWYEPVIQVLVRPTRYTYELMENAKRFAVCVPVQKLKKELAYCGSYSGRDKDKIKECGFKLVPGQSEGVSVIEGCDIYYECEIIHKNKVLKETLDPEITKEYYPKSDQHTIYTGRILKVYERQ
ncbi:MAG: flavin reductase family protein [Elusimicrobiota bacterium]